MNAPLSINGMLFSGLGPQILYMDHHHHHKDHHLEPAKEVHSYPKDQGHDAHSGHDHHQMIDDFRKRFWISLIVTIPVVVLSPMVMHILGYHIEFPGRDLISFVLSSFIFFYGGYPFLTGFIKELKQRKPGMMTLIAVAIIVGYIYSSAIVFGLKGEMFFWELATLIVIMLLGHWIEMRSVMGASRSLELLVRLLPSEANLKDQNGTRKVKIGELKKGDVVVVKPGEKIPVDGVVISGGGYIDESMLTGESKPVKKDAGAKVIAGSVTQNATFDVRVEGTGKDSYLSRVITLVEEAQQTKSQTQRLADKAAFWLTIISLIAGFTTFFVWLSTGSDLAFALERMVTVMIISCPHALGLAIPLVVAISTSVSARNGLLVRNRTAFENARKITMLVFDKTGTLTKGSHGVTSVEVYDPYYSEKELIRLASGLEQNSEHPISVGIVRKAGELGLVVPAAENFKYQPGKGIEGSVEGKQLKIGGPNFIETSKDVQLKQSASHETVVYINVDGVLAGSVRLADEIREDSYDAIKILKENGIRTLLLTGDNENVAASVSKELGMDGYLANVLPHEKLEKIKEQQDKGEFVAMTGDGVNDAPALAQADVGIAIGSGTDIAAETADIILVNSNPKDVAALILFGKATYRKMIQNLIYATAYNVVALPLGAGILYSKGIMVSPAVGAVLMSLSTVVVAINAQLLRRQLKAERSTRREEHVSPPHTHTHYSHRGRVM